MQTTKKQMKELIEAGQRHINIQRHLRVEFHPNATDTGEEIHFKFCIDPRGFNGNIVDCRSMGELLAQVKEILNLGDSCGQTMWLGADDDDFDIWAVIS